MDVDVDRDRGYRSASDKQGEVAARGFAAPLIHLGRIDAMEAHAVTADHHGVPVHDAGLAGDWE